MSDISVLPYFRPCYTFVNRLDIALVVAWQAVCTTSTSVLLYQRAAIEPFTGLVTSSSVGEL